MTRPPGAPRRLPRALAIAAACLILAPPLGRAVQDRGVPGYLKRLSLPGAGDRLRQPLAVHADLHAGEIFVCDRLNHRIVIFDERGLYAYEIRGGGVFSTPIDVAVDPDGLIVLLAYRGTERTLMRLDFDGRPLGTFALSGLPDGSRAPRPISIALAPDGSRLYVLDEENFRLWIADRDGRVSGSFDLLTGLNERQARDQILGQVDAYGDVVLVGLPMLGAVQLLGPDGGSLGLIGIKGTGVCQMAFPVSAALDMEGNVVVLDRQRTLMTVWTTSDRRCTGEISGIGRRPGLLYQPADLALDARGRIYVSQGFEGRVQVFEHRAGAAGPESRALVAPR